MKIAIIGAGAMGCLFACLLDNYEVTLYDVSPVAVERINRDGILLQEPDGPITTTTSPLRISVETPSSALMADAPEKCFFRSRT